MGVNRLKVLVQNLTTGKIQMRRWSKAELMKSIAWLKRMNARGNDILVQPDERHGLALVRALTNESISAMGRNGFEPAVSIETRPGIYQVWIKLAARPASDKALQAASEGLARRFSGKADTTGYLAGFTVHGAAAEVGDRPPFALAHEGQRQAATLGTSYLAKIEQELRDQIHRSRSKNDGPGISR